MRVVGAGVDLELLDLGATEAVLRQHAGNSLLDGALRILKPLHLDGTGQVCYPVINPGGAYFGADRYELALEVGQDASLLSTTQSATKVYRTPQGPARQAALHQHAPLEELHQFDRPYPVDHMVVVHTDAPWFRKKGSAPAAPSLL